MLYSHKKNVSGLKKIIHQTNVALVKHKKA